MFPISFRNRIAIYFSITTALLLIIVFIFVFLIVKAAVYSDLDNDLQNELDDLFTEITITEKGFAVEQDEWREKEHTTLNINPIFIQFTDINGNYFDKSPNLKQSYLRFKSTPKDKANFDTVLDTVPVRQVQAPVYNGNKLLGYIIVAEPLEDANLVLLNLQNVLLIIYPLMLIMLFSITRLVIGRSIQPVNNIIYTTGRISRTNLSERIPYPDNKDELYTLSHTINSLLDRIESAVLREKQFTSDASHELRTPLAVIKGTLEVLIRKPRSQHEFIEKISFCIKEVDRINLMVDQLLLLARFESQKEVLKSEPVNINAVIFDTLSRYSQAMQEKNLSLKTTVQDGLTIDTDAYMFSIILDNLISNATKYSVPDGHMAINANMHDGIITLEISDTGIGIAPEDIERVFGSFYRSRPEDHAQTKGSGLGLSIVKRISELLGFEIEILSKLNLGTSVKMKKRL